jgi:hypothetical protein
LIYKNRFSYVDIVLNAVYYIKWLEFTRSRLPRGIA